MHIYAVNHFADIVCKQIERIVNSGLIDFVDVVYYVVIGEEFSIEHKKFSLLAHSEDMTFTENHTLNLLRNVALEKKENFPLFYIHTKGVTKPEKQCLQDWREYMEYYCLDKWVHCLEGLETTDTAGVNVRIYAKKRYHYSGNFWWANSRYIKQLPELSEVGYGRKVNRWDGEFWIGDGTCDMMQLWNSRTHHATHIYPLRLYENKLKMTVVQAALPYPQR